MKIALALAVAALIAKPPIVPPKPDRVYKQAVVRVSDGDTFDVDIMVMGQPTRVRLARVDTPEKGRFAKCVEEDAASQRATAYLRDLLDQAGWVVYLRGGKKDLYNRPIVEAVIKIGTKRLNLSDALVTAGLALSYDGGTKSDWCARLRTIANDN